MKKWLSFITAAGLLLYPFATFADDYGSQSLQTQQGPPVAQTLVREGDFAVKLAATLDLGSPTNEADAEDMLVKAGVVPLNGWLSDYPMTPQIVGQLQSSIARAADEGKLPMTRDEATRGLSSLTAKLRLPAPAGPGTEAVESTQSPPEQAGPSANPAVINNYYYDEGPPVITYYPPPYDYVCLYDWVPYPVFWFGFWFPGFFICHNFTTVVVDRTVFVNRRVIVSNHVIDPVTRREAFVSPVTRTGTGAVRPVTMLRTENGGTFRNITDLRREAGAGGVHSATTGPSPNRALGTEAFRSPEARRSAAAIYARSSESRRPGRGEESVMARSGERRSPVPSTPAQRAYSRPYGSGESRYMAPSRPERSYGRAPSRIGERPSAPPSRPERSFNASTWGGGERRFVGPSGPSRSLSGAVTRGDRAPLRSMLRNGWHGR